MPAVGDQHKPNGATANPFDDPETTEKKLHISEYTAQEIATLQSRLDKQLGPEYISSRPGAGGQKVHYLAADKAIQLANEVFGFNGWSSSIQNIQIDFVDENPNTGKISLGLSVTVRVTLKDGTYHEDVGYGSIDNCKGKAPAFEKAKKEGTTDALKRALRNFGNVLGNCIYDKEYLAKVTKVKVPAGKWDVDHLHRHRDFRPKEEPAVKQEVKQTAPATNDKEKDSSATEVTSEFDMADFEDAEFDEHDFGHPDEVVLPPDPRDPATRTTTSSNYPSNLNARSNMTTPSKLPSAAPGMRPPNAPNPGQHPGHQRMASASVSNNAFAQQAAINTARTTEPRHPSQEDFNNNNNNNNNNDDSSSPGLPPQHFSAPGTTGGAAQRIAGFYSARAATKITADNNVIGGPGAAPRFNPHAESPSIRKTSGVDHNKSARLLKNLAIDPEIPQREEIGAPPGEAMQRSGSGPGVPPVPQAGPRPINANMAAGMRTSAYRPPTRRAADPQSASFLLTTNTNVGYSGGVERVLTATKRPPLHDVSNVQQHSVTAMTDDGVEAKRQRVGGHVQNGVIGAAVVENRPGAGGVG